ncbi:hypothetical protein O181_105477 [Austropuccinia psidii MF-1]|uniref:Chromo domain-containing protein n=1 Tax=Austropuccinia psidii MF-1 TaxID=1389203 RepID=A0A9Q3PMF2_9BASI|nr:hypothetical protein [Austropuccinia psidii MF-1]
MYVSYHQDDWHTWLPLAECAYNNAQNSSKKQSPFFTIYGRNKTPISTASIQRSIRNINTTRPTKKLSERWLGPFEVIKKIGSHAHHFKFPQQWKSAHPAFHVSLLEPVKQSTIQNKYQFPPPPVLVEEQEEWEVAQVLDSKLKRGKLWYLVEWKGFSEDPERTTWEPASNLTNSPDLVKDFHSLYPDKPGPNTSRV